jgi:hypothetical protein
MIRIVYQNDILICELDDSIPVLRHRWTKEPTDDQFESGLIELASQYRDLKKSFKKLAWLADTKLLGELSSEVEQWLENTWEGLLFRESGVTIHAVILGENIFADFPMEKFKMNAEEKFNNLNVHLGVFSNQQAAYEWIKRLI